jgi:hypothetical protein
LGAFHYVFIIRKPYLKDEEKVNALTILSKLDEERGKMKGRNLRQLVLIGILFIQLFLVTGRIGAVPPLPIGNPGYYQSSPYESNPTAHTTNLTLTNPADAYDGVLSTNVNFYYGIQPNGYLELSTFNTTAPSQFTIGWIDLKITYKALGTGATDDRYRIVYLVDPSPTEIVLHDWVTGSAAVFPNGASAVSPPANRPWNNVTEPNDGVWSWTDISNLRVRVETQQVGTNNFQRIYIYDVWLSVYSTQLPQTGVTLQPTLISGLHANDYLFYDVYIYNGSNPISKLWGYQFLINYDTSILTAVDYFSYHPFNIALPSAINDTGGYVAVSYTSFGGDTVGLTSNSPLARIYFRVDTNGKSALHFSKALLSDVFGHDLSPNVNDGVFTTSPIHDVATVNVNANTTIAAPGGNVEVEVTIMNEGTFDENSISVVAHYDSTPFGNQNVGFLGSGLTTRLSFTWNTSGVPVGLKQIGATVDLTGDQDASNDIFLDGNVLVGHHDISVSTVTRISPTNVTVPENETLKVEKGTIVYINVTVLNVGNFPETSINVTAKWKNIDLIIGNTTGVAVGVGVNKTVTFRWNTTEGWVFDTDRYGHPVNHTTSPVEGIASQVPYEKGTDYDLTANNNLVGGLVNITRPLMSPFALFVFSPKPNAFTGQPVKFDATPPGFSQTPNGTEIVSYQWDFGDGNITTVPNPIVYHAYMSNGTYQISLMVTNNLSLTDLTAPGTERELTVLNRNMLVLDMTVSSTSIIVGSTVTINVTVMNRGDDYELFNVTAYYGNSVIQKLNSSQNGGFLEIWESRIVSFSWNTTGVTAGTYVIKASIDTLQWESNTTDNTFVDGEISILWHNVALTNIVSSPTEVTIGAKVSINVTAVNQGNFTETFTVAIQLNNTEVGNQTVTGLASGSSQTLSFIWDTTGANPGSYSIKAVASTVSGETQIGDNTLTGSTIILKAPASLDIWLYAIAGVAAVIVVALVLFYFFKIRKPK